MGRIVYSKPAVRVASKDRRTYEGVLYASRTEAMYARALDVELRQKYLYWWVRQPVFYLGCPENRYAADFLVVNFDGTHVVDVKAAKGETRAFRRTRKLWAAYGPCILLVARPTANGTWDHEVLEGGKDIQRGRHER